MLGEEPSFWRKKVLPPDPHFEESHFLWNGSMYFIAIAGLELFGVSNPLLFIRVYRDVTEKPIKTAFFEEGKGEEPSFYRKKVPPLKNTISNYSVVITSEARTSPVFTPVSVSALEV